MKKIQIFAREDGYTGFAKEIVMLANALSNLYQIEIVYINYSDTTPYHLNKKISVKYINDGLSIFILKKLKKVISEYQANIIISTNIWFNKFILLFNKKSNLIYWDHSFGDEVIMDKSLTKFKTVVYASKRLFDKSELNNKLYIPDGIKIDAETPNDLSTKNLVYLGKLNKNKHLDELLEIMSIVRSKDKEINLAIIGDGEERANLVSLAKKLRLGLSVTFFGALSDEEKKDILVDSSICVSTSESKSFGVTFLELMSYGVPVIAYDTAITNDEIIKDELNGYIIKNQDKEDMAKKILKLISDRDLLHSFGGSSYETALVYDINNIKNDWIKILK